MTCAPRSAAGTLGSVPLKLPIADRPAATMTTSLISVFSCECRVENRRGDGCMYLAVERIQATCIRDFPDCKSVAEEPPTELPRYRIGVNPTSGALSTHLSDRILGEHCTIAPGTLGAIECAVGAIQQSVGTQ